MSTLHTIAFDLDGTLADSREGVWRTIVAALEALDRPTPSRDAVDALIGLPLDVVLARSGGFDLTADADALAALADDYRARFPAEALPHTRAIDGVAALLEQLAAAGLRLAVATSKNRDVATSVLSRLSLDHHFAFIGGGDMVGPGEGKPGPALLEAVLARVEGAAPATALVVGDTTYDVEMARRAGARAVGVSWGSHTPEDLRAAGADEVFDDPHALGQWILSAR